MEFQVPIHIKQLSPAINYKERILLTGSCFTEHIGDYLAEVKFNILQNPNGIVFDPLSVCNSLVSYIQNRKYHGDELFYLNECWNSWQHHSRFSNPDKELCIHNINQSQQRAHHFLKEADWLIITFGSSFMYKLNADVDQDLNPGHVINVANCHKAPAQLFSKHLLSIEETITALDNTIHQLFHFNKKIRIIFTISPVRHIRDGVIDNNRSKARLIEAVHHLVNKFERLYYFPAYELVVDVLRDYRFFDIDLVHPNYAATQYVLEHFAEKCIDVSEIHLMKEIQKLVLAKRHKAFNPNSLAHKKFLRMNEQKAAHLQASYPHLNFEEELTCFAS